MFGRKVINLSFNVEVGQEFSVTKFTPNDVIWKEELYFLMFKKKMLGFDCFGLRANCVMVLQDQQVHAV